MAAWLSNNNNNENNNNNKQQMTLFIVDTMHISCIYIVDFDTRNSVMDETLS